MSGATLIMDPNAAVSRATSLCGPSGQTRRAALAGILALPAAAGVTNTAWGALADRFSAFDAASKRTVNNDVYAAFLDRYLEVVPDGVNLVRYADVTPGDLADLKSYVASLEATSVETLNRDEQFAFWLNLYNAQTLVVVLDEFPVNSIRNIRPSLFALGPWKKKYVSVGGEALSLDDIEHEILRPGWKDPRVHYGVNCASIGCPDLLPEPFTGDGLDGTLDAAAHAYVNHPRGVRIEGGKAIASKIYTWFQEDFGGTEAGVLAHLKSHAAPALAEELDQVADIHRYEYDWALNGTSRG
jgi:hypothetical protein